PVIIDGRTLVPIRDIFEEMDAEILWNEQSKEATIKKDNNKVTFKIDSNQAIKNNVEIVKLDVPAKIINDYTMVPIRAISDSIGYSVDWDNNIRTIIIETPINQEKEDTTISTETSTEIIPSNIE